MQKQDLTLVLCTVSVAFLATGCGKAEPDAGSPSVPANQACRGGDARPIQVEDVIRVFAAHGVTLYDDPLCVHDDAARQAANLILYGPNVNVKEHTSIKESQGDVTCLLDASPGSTLASVAENRYTGDVETSFRLGNVTCILYPADGSEDSQLANVRAAMHELRRDAVDP